jgi:hypothetical protein
MHDYKMTSTVDDLEQGWRHRLVQGPQRRFELVSVHHVHGGHAWESEHFQAPNAHQRPL